MVSGQSLLKTERRLSLRVRRTNRKDVKQWEAFPTVRSLLCLRGRTGARQGVKMG